jgi:hypothetical protein
MSRRCDGTIATETIFRHLDLYWRGTMDVFKTFVERQFSSRKASGMAVDDRPV